MCFDDENESVVSAQQDYTEDDFNIGDRVNTRNGAGVVAGIAEEGYPTILVQHDEWRKGHDGNDAQRSGEEIPDGSGYYYYAHELTKIEAENALDVKVGEEVEVVTDHGQEDDYYHAYAPGAKVSITKILGKDRFEVEQEGDYFTQTLRRKDFKKIEAPVPVKAEEKPLQLINGEGLSDEQQHLFEMLVGKIVAIPMGYAPDDNEFRGRLLALADNLDSYIETGERPDADLKQTSFEDGIGQIAFALGMTKTRQLSSAVRAFEKNTRIIEEAGAYAGLSASA